MKSVDPVIANTPPPRAEFDQFSHDYEALLDTPALKTLGGGTSREFIRVKCIELLNIIRLAGLDPSKLIALDAGCGTGIAEEFLAPHFQRITGVDLSPGMVAAAKAKNIPRCLFEVGDAAQISLRDAQVDVVFSICIFHHANNIQQKQFISEFKRILRPGGMTVAFEHNAWNPLTQYVVRKCPVDRDAKLIACPSLKKAFLQAGYKEVRSRYLIFFPRWMHFLLPLERYLSWLPIGSQYAVSGRI